MNSHAYNESEVEEGSSESSVLVLESLDVEKGKVDELGEGSPVAVALSGQKNTSLSAALKRRPISLL